MVALGVAAAAAVTVAATSVLASNGRVGPSERSVFTAVNGLPDILQAPMWVLQLMGVTGTAVVVGLIVLWRRRIRLAVALFALVPLKLFTEHIVVKNLVHRERPGSTVPDAERMPNRHHQLARADGIVTHRDGRQSAEID